MEQQKSSVRLALGLTLLSGLARLLPHPPNFTPVGGLSLFAGARLRGWMAYLVPLAIMAATDPLLAAIYGIPGYTRVSPFIYASFLINVWIGRTLLTRSEKPVRIGAAAFLCSLQFFFVTNLGVWAGSHVYDHSLAGLLQCYLAALPFFGRTLAGDLFYSAALFGLYSWLSWRLAPAERPSLQAA